METVTTIGRKIEDSESTPTASLRKPTTKRKETIHFSPREKLFMERGDVQ